MGRPGKGRALLTAGNWWWLVLLPSLLLSLVGCQSQPPVMKDPALQQALALALELADKRERELAEQAIGPETHPEGYTSQGKKLSIVNIASIETLNDGIHDIGNNAFMTLQDPTVALEGFPLDRRLQVNWVATLDQGLIEPRADLHGSRDMLVMDMDILMTNTKDMPYVRFPHLQHTKWLDCSNCHPKIFIPQEHANPISMNKVLRGEYCGVCHDKVAFALFTCERCHSVPHERSGKWW